MPIASPSDNAKTTYDCDGYVIHPSLLSAEKLQTLETALAYHLKVNPGEDLIAAMRNMERTDKAAFYQLCTQEIWFTIAALSLITDPDLMRHVALCAGSAPEQLTPVGHGLIWNDPQCTRLHTKWHQEAAYYPGFKNVISVWFPLVYDLNEDSGPMLVARGSHKEAIDCQREIQKGGVTHMEINESVIQKFDIVPCTMNRGDGIIFHQNLIHTTGINRTQRPRLSAVIRYANLNTETNKTPYWIINPEF